MFTFDPPENIGKKRIKRSTFIFFYFYVLNSNIILPNTLMARGVAVITAAQLHSTLPGPRFYASSNPARGVSEICDGEDLLQCSRLEIG